MINGGVELIRDGVEGGGAPPIFLLPVRSNRLHHQTIKGSNLAA